MQRYASKFEAVRFLPWGPYNEQESIAFLNRMLRQQRDRPRRHYELAIDVGRSGDRSHVVGSGSLILGDNLDAELGLVVHPDFWGKGLGSAVVTLLCEYAFKRLSRHRVFAMCDVNNIAAERILRRSGFILEGTLRENVCVRGQWRCSHLFGVLRADREDQKPGP